MPVKLYPLWDNKELRVPEFWSRNGMSVTKSITWDEGTTNILGARLDITVDPGRIDTRAWIEHNGVETPLWYWEWEHNPKSDSFDIIGSLKNGSNLFKFVGAKDILTYPLLAVFVVTASVVIEYEGDEPEVGEDWAKMLQEAVYGVAIGGGTYIVASSLLVKKEKV